jgi:transposase-like protein
MVVCDGLKGLPAAIETVWPQAITQWCIVHLLRNSFRYASKKHWVALAKGLKPIYTAPSESAALDAFVAFTEAWSDRYPAIIILWESAWPEFVPFLQFDKHIRAVACTTNAIVIWRSFGGVLDVRHAGSRSLILQPGRGYLQSSRKQSLRRDDASCTSHLPGFVA